MRVLRGVVLAATAFSASGACAPRAATPPLTPLSRDAYAHYLRGRVAAYEGDHGLAVQELRAAAAAAPDEGRIDVALIDALLRADRQMEAAEVADVAQRRWPRDPEVWLASGAVYRKLGATERALAAYQQAIRLDRRDERGYVGLGTTWTQLGEPGRAEDTWRDLLRAVPTSIEGHYRLAARLLDRGLPRDAEPHLRAVLERDPDHVDARLALGRALRLQNRLPEAIAAHRQAFDRAGNPVDVGEELFWLLLEADDRRAAVDLLGLLDDPSADSDDRVTLSRLYLTLGDLDRAQRQAETALAAAPASGEAMVAMARVQRDRGELDGAVATAMAVPETSPAMASARSLASEILIERGDAAAAVAAVEAARAVHPRDPDLVLAHALALHARGRDADARHIVDAAVRAQPRSVGLLYAWATFEDETGHPDRAMAIVDRLLASDDDYIAALNFAGFTRADRGRDLDRAQRLLERARRLAPGDPYVMDSWGWLLHRRGRQRDAARALAHAARIAPREPEILLHLGEVWAALGDPRKAQGVLESARALAPPQRLRARIDARLTALRGGR